MKILELKVEGYKNIINTIHFNSNNGPILVVGTNGSGKSNLLEAVSAIFAACYEKKLNVSPFFEFEILYEREKPSELMDVTMGAKLWVRITNSDGAIKVFYANQGTDPNIEVKAANIRMLLPDHVIAIYSGEETRLWERYYFSPYDSYNKQYMTGKSAYQRQSMVYFNHYYWNLIASILAIDEIEEHRCFLHERIGLTNISSIQMSFDVAKAKKNKNEMAQRIIALLNPDLDENVEVNLEKLYEVRGLCGYEKDMLFHMAVLILYKSFKIITSFNIMCSNGIQIEDLSEGEKKLLLIYGAINITAGENLYLFDEPDAHLHEGRKREIYELLCSDEKSQFLVSSHSPSMTQMFQVENVIFAQRKDGKTSFDNGKMAQIISKLTNDEWKYIDHSLFMEKERSLVLVEGDGDVKYIKKAIEVLSQGNSQYEVLNNIDFLHCGGANNIPHTLEQLQSCLPENKKVIAVFDRDDQGLKGIKKIIERDINTSNDRIYKRNEFYTFMLPKTEGYSYSTFVIEDYFSNEYKKEIAADCVNGLAGHLNEFPNMQQYVKNELGKRLSNYGKTELEGFRTLLDTFIGVLNEELMGKITEF